MTTSTETPKERKRRKDRERKQAQRAKEKAHRKAVGAKEFRIEFYNGTQEALKRLMEFNDCEEWQEINTLLIHGAEKLIKRDPSLLKELLKV